MRKFLQKLITKFIQSKFVYNVFDHKPYLPAAKGEIVTVVTKLTDQETRDAMAKKCVGDYKPKLDATKADPLDLASYKVTKPWGHEVWLDINESYAYKLISMKKGQKCSLQSHDFKVEANYVLSGKAEVSLEDENGNMVSKIYTKGTGWTVPVGRIHQVHALETYVALEVSSPHLDDVIRYNDDRPSGKIESEHAQKCMLAPGPVHTGPGPGSNFY
jgi:mannose-6-phosphate isomerase-like protein (cupin superfamily)